MAGVAAVYLNALGASFQFDDWNVIVKDTRVQSLAAWWHSMPGIRPLLKLTYAVNHATGFGVVGFHAVNISIHAANALLVLLLLERLSRREGATAPAARLAALIGALLFALHPVQTEAVTYVSGRSVSLMALFALGSVLATIEGLERGRRVMVYGLAPVLFACALGVKEIAVAVPAVVLLWIVTDTRQPIGARQVARALGGHAVVLTLAVTAFAASPTYRGLLTRSLEQRSVIDNLQVQVDGVSYLLGQFVRIDRLNADPIIATSSVWSPMFTLEVLVVAGVLALGTVSLRSRPALAFGVGWCALWLAPTNSLVARLDVANDRQLYLALIGPAWLVGHWVAASSVRRGPVMAGVIAASCLLGAATMARNRVYADEVRFWEDVVRKGPDNARALNNLGYAYALACRTGEADAAFVIAVDLAPGDAKSAANLTLLRAGSLVPPGCSK